PASTRRWQRARADRLSTTIRRKACVARARASRVPVGPKLTLRGLGNINGRGHAGNRQHGVREGFTAHLEVRVLVEGGAGWRQQDHGFLQARGGGVTGCRIDCGRQGAVDLVGHLAVQRRGKLPGGFTNQIGLADPRKEPGQAGNSTGFRLAARNPENVGKLASALAAESALVAFESLTNSTLPLRP